LSVALAGLFMFGGCELLSSLTGDNGGEDGGPEGTPPCAVLCEWEEECGIRTASQCRSSRCGVEDPDNGAADAGAHAPLFDSPDFDSCIEAARDCQTAVLCTCPAACDKVEDCVGSPDPQCVDTCETLLGQLLETTVAENMCILEEACDDIAACGGVAG
jgi:hypothetical protein